MEFSKLNAPSLKELFIHELETRILSGRLAIGDKLPPEREIAESMQISRAVVNGGITALARKGFLTIKPRVGTFVSDYRRNGTMETLISIMNYNSGVLRADEIRSILEVRIALDSLAVRQCIPKITDDELLLLINLAEKIQTSATSSEASSYAFNFQHELAILSGNVLIPLIFQSFKIPVLSLWERYCQLHGIESLYQNTISLCRRIEERDIEKAIECLTDYINETIMGERQIYY